MKQLISSTPDQLEINSRWFSQQILNWAKVNGRHNFPWQSPHTPYKTWISEIMLQQTQAQRVVGFFTEFIGVFPTIEILAQAQEDEVFHYWSGLGYYTRAQNLLKTAKILACEPNANLPKEVTDLMALPGIGRSTAGAIRSLGHGLDAPILDGNVRRVLGRFSMIQGKPQSKTMENTYWDLTTKLTPGKAKLDRKFNQGMMDLGATICTIRAPKCEACPLQEHCQAYQQNVIEQYPITASKYKKQHQQIAIKKRNETRFYLLVQSKKKVLLEKRPPIGIWRNLWCPQEFKDLDSLHSAAHASFGPNIILKTLEPLQHSFSHFDLELKPYLVHIETTKVKARSLQTGEPNRYLWYNLVEPQPVGLASPVIKLLNRLAET